MAGAVGHAEGSPDSIHISHIGVRDHSTRDHHLGPVSCEFTGKPESKVKLRLKPGHSQMGCCYLKQHLKHCAKHSGCSQSIWIYKINLFSILPFIRKNSVEVLASRLLFLVFVCFLFFVFRDMVL